jgi:hypothetical protein
MRMEIATAQGPIPRTGHGDFCGLGKWARAVSGDPASPWATAGNRQEKRALEATEATRCLAHSLNALFPCDELGPFLHADPSARRDAGGRRLSGLPKRGPQTDPREDDEG